MSKEQLQCCECKWWKQLDQLKEQLEAYKMEAEEGKEINAELKAENEELKRQLKVKGNILKLTDEANNEYLKENNKLKRKLTEIKELLLKTPTDSREHFLNTKSVILQICDEVNDG